jgi:uncharacterized protein (DUF362 family)
MKPSPIELQTFPCLTRREFMRGAFGGMLAGVFFPMLGNCTRQNRHAEAFIAGVESYAADIASVILSGLRELKIGTEEIRGKRILLKPNLIEPHRGADHINTHPLVVRGVAEAFLKMGARNILVAEGTGHNRDTLMVLEESGIGDVLREDRIPFVDLNVEAGYLVRNAGGHTRIATFTFPLALRQVDWIVSVAKMKTHHWAGVTLSMKNMFGVMPGICYGFPKNLFHWEGIDKSILDINATVRPHFAIVDGIVGMEGDGPIMGEPRKAGVLVMGRNLPAVDATCARIMGIEPRKIAYLAAASGWLGTIREADIHQRGEAIASVRTNFALVGKIDAHRGIRLSYGSPEKFLDQWFRNEKLKG